MSDPIAREVAEDEFARLCDALDVDTEDMDAEDQESFDDLKRVIVNAIRKGRLTIDEIGQPTVALKFPVGEIRSVTFFRPKGEHIMSLGDSRKKNDLEKLTLAMADITKQPSSVFTKMDYASDGKLCQRVVRLFLA